MASTEVITASEFSSHGSKFVSHAAPWYTERSVQGTSGGKGTGAERRVTDTQTISIRQSSLRVLTDEIPSQGTVAPSPVQEMTGTGLSNILDTILMVRSPSQQMPGVQVQESHVVSWSSGTLRCRDVQCSSKISDGFMSTSCPVVRGKSIPSLSSLSDYNHSAVKSPPADSPKRPATELDSLSPPLKALHEGMLAFGKSQLSEFSAFKLDFSPAVSSHLDPGTPSTLCLSDLLPGRLQISAQEARAQESVKSGTDAISLSDSCGRGVPPRGCEQACQDPYSGVGTPQMTREDDGTGEGEERSLLLPQGGLPRARSILVIKTVNGQAEGGRERGSKRVRWRDGDGDTLTSVREFESSDQSELYDDLLDEQGGFCSCCTVS